MPKPRVNQMRERPRLQPTMSLALLVQVGAMPGWPGASPCGSGPRSAMPAPRRAPQLEAAEESVLVVAEPDVFRELLELAGIAAADHHIVRLERGHQPFDHLRHLVAPLLRSEALQSRGANIVLVRPAALEREVAELHRLEDAVDDHGRAEAGAEAEEQHAAALIAPERLHGGVVD